MLSSNNSQYPYTGTYPSYPQAGGVNYPGINAGQMVSSQTYPTTGHGYGTYSAYSQPAYTQPNTGYSNPSYANYANTVSSMSSPYLSAPQATYAPQTYTPQAYTPWNSYGQPPTDQFTLAGNHNPYAYPGYSLPSNPMDTQSTIVPGPEMPGLDTVEAEQSVEQPKLVESNIQKQINKSRLSSMTPQQKLEKTQQQVKDLMKTLKTDTNQILQHFSGMGVHVYDSGNDPWVNQILEQTGESQALLFVPDSLYFPDREGQSFALDPQEWKTAKTKADNEKAMVLLVRKDMVQPSTLYQKLFMVHALLNGLPPCGDNYEAVQQASQFVLANKPTKNWLMRLKQNLIDLPWLAFKRGFGGAKPNPEGPGESVRIMAQREIEATQFVLANKWSLGLSRAETTSLEAKIKDYQRLQKLSAKLDR